MSFDQQQAVARLASVLVEEGWQVKHPAYQEDGFDLIVENGPHRYVIEVKAAREARRPLLEGLLASGILRARVAARLHKAQPLPVVFAPAISESILGELQQFAQHYGEGTSWGAVDEDGLVVFFAAGLQSAARERRRSSKRPISPSRFDVFSDLGQWMLKVLLSHQLPPELQVNSADGSPIKNPISNAASLANVSGVSVASAARLVSAFREDRFCEGPPLRMIRPKELLERWQAASRKRPLDLRARWIFPNKDPIRQLEESLKRQHGSGHPDRVCLGLFAACDRLGFRFVSGVSPHVYLESVSAESLERLGLRPAEPGESADVFVRQPRFPEAVFRAAKERGGVPVADVLQCWLDVSDYPARGMEMSEHLYQKVIGPHIVREA